MAVVLEVTCRARRHGEHARDLGCVCPVAFGVPYRPPRRTLSDRARHNMRGPRRRTCQHSDWVAIERAMIADRSVVLAVVDRDAAIDRLDAGGASAAWIARQLGISKRTVDRRRAARRGECRGE